MSAKRLSIVVVLGLVATAALVVGYHLVLRCAVNSLEQRAWFGEAFGGLNSVFSGLGLLGVATALLLNYHQIRDSERALASAAALQARANEALATQAALGALSARVNINAQLLAMGDAVAAKRDNESVSKEMTIILRRLEVLLKAENIEKKAPD